MTDGRGTQPSPIVLLNNLDLVTLGFAFHARPPRSTHNNHHIVFPCHEGTLRLIQSARQPLSAQLPHPEEKP
jgi:hypothetical protein